jgi:hypothetical protein
MLLQYVADTFGDMVPQTMQVHKKSAYNDPKIIEGENPFSPISRGIMSYDISNTLAEEEDDSNWNTKGKGKSQGKNKAKGKKRAPKDPAFMVIPPFGAAIAPYAIVMFTINSLEDAGNPYHVRPPTPIKRSMSPGQIIMMPDDTLIVPRLRPDQRFDRDTLKMYHQALQAIHHVNTSPINYCVQECTHGRVHHVSLQGKDFGSYDHAQLKYNLVDDTQIATLGNFHKVLRVRPSATLGDFHNEPRLFG